jgi:hypothetical protein
MKKVLAVQADGYKGEHAYEAEHAFIVDVFCTKSNSNLNHKRSSTAI